MSKLSTPGRQSLPGPTLKALPKVPVIKKNGASPGRRGRKIQTHRFDLPLKEAKKDTFLPLLQIDADNAEKYRNKENVDDEATFCSCVIAQAVTRTFGAEHVAIQRSVAYIAFPGEKCTRRYIIPPETRDIIERWDRGETVEAEIGISLKAPTGTSTAAAKRQRQRDYLKANPGYQKQRKTSKKLQASDPLHSVVRNGNLVRWA